MRLLEVYMQVPIREEYQDKELDADSLVRMTASDLNSTHSLTLDGNVLVDSLAVIQGVRIVDTEEV